MDEYYSIDDVGYVRKDVRGQQQFEELELMGSDHMSEMEASGGVLHGAAHSSSTPMSEYEEQHEDDDEEDQGSQGGEDVASLSETEDLGKVCRSACSLCHPN